MSVISMAQKVAEQRRNRAKHEYDEARRLVAATKYGLWSGTGASDPLEDYEQLALGVGTKQRYYRFVQNPRNPLTYHHPDGTMWRPKSGLVHNFGSIPRLVQAIPGYEKDRHPDAYVLHDQGYQTGHGVLCSRDGGATWHDEPVSKCYCDHMLYLSIMAEMKFGEITMKHRVKAVSIYAAVSLFGKNSWNSVTIRLEA